MTAKQLIKKIEAIGWRLDRTKGSHKIFIHPDKPNHLSIPDHGKEDLKIGLLNALLKQAGLK
jgi:predicted RNA binding protein YcfA (HicA-like mRNA interferase family)